MTIDELFENLKRIVEPEIDNVLPTLLKKATDTSVFIAEEAEKALIRYF